MRSCCALRGALILLLLAAAGLAGPVARGGEPPAGGSAEILLLRDGTPCPGIPGLRVRLDGGGAALIGAGEYLRLSAAPGAHALDFYPALPEHIALDAQGGKRYAFLVTTFRLGWHCKFGIAPATDEAALAGRLAAASEVSLTAAQGPRPELSGTEGQLILTRP